MWWHWNHNHGSLNVYILKTHTEIQITKYKWCNKNDLIYAAETSCTSIVILWERKKHPWNDHWDYVQRESGLLQPFSTNESKILTTPESLYSYMRSTTMNNDLFFLETPVSFLFQMFPTHSWLKTLQPTMLFSLRVFKMHINSTSSVLTADFFKCNLECSYEQCHDFSFSHLLRRYILTK